MPLSRTACFRKKALVFTESPVETRHIPVTPVLCADRPITAMSVPISDDCSHPWVSPQFPDGRCCSGKCRRKRREPRSKVNKPSASNIGCMQNGSGKESMDQKYRALAFVTRFERGVSSNQLQNMCLTCQTHKAAHPCHCNLPCGGWNNDVCLERKRRWQSGCKNTESETTDVSTDALSEQRRRQKGCGAGGRLLVLNTPEHEYHLSYRQRQLKKAESLFLVRK